MLPVLLMCAVRYPVRLQAVCLCPMLAVAVTTRHVAACQQLGRASAFAPPDSEYTLG